MKNSKSVNSSLILALALLTVASLNAQTAQQKQAQQILDATGIKGGLVVHLGCRDGKLTAALRASDSFLVHGLDADSKLVAKAREFLQSQGVYGNVAIDQLPGGHLPYIDNLVNLVVKEQGVNTSKSEILRILAPGGVAYTNDGGKWTKTVKPRPDNIDDWSHYMHDATGNSVAHDTVVGPPRHLQWHGSPRWSRHHDRMASMSALVSAGGRMFYIMDEGSRVSIQLPPKWSLIARDAFNGTILWKRPIKEWFSHLWPLKSGPTQLARRLVATKDIVYVTLSLGAPLTALDAATGKTVTTYDDSGGTEEVIVSEGSVFVLVNKGKWALDGYTPKHNVGDQKRVAKEFYWNEKPRQIMAFDVEKIGALWKKETSVAPLTMAADSERLYFHDGEKIVCLNRSSGEEHWSSPPAKRRPKVNFNFGPKLVVYGDVVLFAGGDRTMRSFAVSDGKELWNAPHGRSGYQSPEDLLVAGGLVWNAPTTSGRDTGVFTGRDPLTGEVKAEFPPDVNTYWFHHRCYMAKATDKYLLPSRTGIEFVDPIKKKWQIHHWVRGGCLYGILPCNGLIYAPPHNCACYPEAKLNGFNALASAGSRTELNGSNQDRLERGPAYEELSKASSAEDTAGSWPTYRNDPARSGFTKAAIPAELKPSWKTDLGGRLSSLVVAGGKAFVAQIDRHIVHALDAGTGRRVWSFTAGGRVDSPPTIYKGRALFGSADGWVYCLRASDGQLAWRYRAAPSDLRITSFEQVESVWPVSGSVLVQDNIVFAVAGRSLFLDGGIHFLKLDPLTGKKITEKVLDDRDPGSGKNLQERIKTLNMPVSLPDVLSSDGKSVYMRSQKFDLEGNRIDLGPHSGDAGQQSSVQKGEQHLFSPTGFLDGSWFHRSYWVYGRSFAGGHSGWYRAGKFAPSGRILVADDANVYGFGRKPQYLKWTTTIEHQLFATSKKPPEAAVETVTEKAAGRRGGGGGGTSLIKIANKPSLNPAGKPLAVEAWVKADKPNGVVVARGGPAQGYALILQGGNPAFVIRSASKVYSVSVKQKVVGKWFHLAGILTPEKKIELYVDGKLAGTAAGEFVASDPAQAMEIGADDGGSVGNYKSPFSLTGIIDEVRVYFGPVSGADIEKHFSNSSEMAAGEAKLVLHCSFDKRKAQDSSGNNHHGEIKGTKSIKGKVGRAMKFLGGGKSSGRGAGSFVKYRWTLKLPMFVRAMVLADKTLFVAGPPDVLDEEESFKRIMARDEKVQANLAEQDSALKGAKGGMMWAVSTDGQKQAEYKLASLPVWDGMVAADGRLYLATMKGEIVCFEGK